MQYMYLEFFDTMRRIIFSSHNFLNATQTCFSDTNHDLESKSDP